ncbi:MAG TPA: 4Fe-4S dicluster domain-containing protein [Actinobacteria bacterium]|nr:4Fe-4S dicluster domain-containing protein [Actinomycetota bacterium]
MPEIPPLTPLPLDLLLRRIAVEWETRRRIFDLPSARIWRRPDDVDLSIDFLGRRAASPVGPAAGPHTQMAQNIVLAWLGGARLFELKTVQVLDELEIARPCIDMETVGYNIEWSQELRVAESLEEYVKAWMILEILRRWEPLGELLGPDPGPHVFDLSVGYDLAGISGEKVAGFIESMRDATAEIDRLRPLVAGPFAAFADLDFPSRIADTVTLSTFHGCPPDEIDAITRHLMDRHGLDVVVKLNPTLLGYEQVDAILHDVLGYDEIRLSREAFDADLQMDRAVELIGDLRDHARRTGRRFGIKLTNTLVVENHKGFLPDDPMYLSGPPLHVISSTLLDALVRRLPGVLRLPGQDGDVQVSFSAGVTKENLADTLAMGVAPATMSTDLLKPGGYGRLKPMLGALEKELRAAGVADLEAWRRLRLEAARSGGHRDPVDAHVQAMLHGDERARYAKDGLKPPRRVDHALAMWGCVACNLCVTVCPNDAVLKVPTPDDADVEGRWQYLVFAELCNECGNCMVFCPEDGDPAQVKPRLFFDPDRFAAADGQRFLVRREPLRFVAAPGWEGDAATLAAVASGPDGLPV